MNWKKRNNKNKNKLNCKNKCLFSKKMCVCAEELTNPFQQVENVTAEQTVLNIILLVRKSSEISMYVNISKKDKACWKRAPAKGDNTC